jgi:hypothetical protein
MLRNIVLINHCPQPFSSSVETRIRKKCRKWKMTLYSKMPKQPWAKMSKIEIQREF